MEVCMIDPRRTLYYLTYLSSGLGRQVSCVESILRYACSVLQLRFTCSVRPDRNLHVHSRTLNGSRKLHTGQDRPPFRFGAPVIGVSLSAEITNRLLDIQRIQLLCNHDGEHFISAPGAHRVFATTSLWQTLNQSANRLIRDLFQRTACSITDLD